MHVPPFSRPSDTHAPQNLGSEAETQPKTARGPYLMLSLQRSAANAATYRLALAIPGALVELCRGGEEGEPL